MFIHRNSAVKDTGTLAHTRYESERDLFPPPDERALKQRLGNCFIVGLQ